MYLKVLLCISCLLCFIFPVFAQGDVTFIGDDTVGMDVAFQIGMAASHSLFGGGTISIGGRVGYYLGSIFFIDSEILHEPKHLQESSTEKTIILGGIRVGTIFDEKIGIFAKLRTGAFNAKNDRLLAPDKFHPIIDIGVILESYIPFNNSPEKKLFTRLDLGNWIIPFGDNKIHSDYRPDYSPIYTRIGTKNFFAAELGFGVRF